MADGARAERLGEIIRRQRELSELSMRQFATLAGISNPYLSQIERGLREPSERVLDAIAAALEVSADTLYEQAGMTVGEEPETERARAGDPRGPAPDRPPAPGAARGLPRVRRAGAPGGALAATRGLSDARLRRRNGPLARGARAGAPAGRGGVCARAASARAPRP